jgi:uncharacterized membrane protein
VETSVADSSQETLPKRPFVFEVESAAFGLRERQRVRRLLLKRRIENWVGTAVVVILAACAVFALITTTSKMTISDDPSIQGFRAKK